MRTFILLFVYALYATGCVAELVGLQWLQYFNSAAQRIGVHYAAPVGESTAQSNRSDAAPVVSPQDAESAIRPIYGTDP